MAAPEASLDILLSGWERRSDKDSTKSLAPSPSSWPEKWTEATSLRWSRLARKHLAKIGLPVDIQAELTAHKKFSVSVSSMLEGARAYHAVKYSVRPMINLRKSRVSGPKNNPNACTLIYKPTTKMRRDVTNRAPLPIFVSIYYHIREMLNGSERVRFVGFLSKGSYPATARAAGHEPVRLRKAKDDPTRRKIVRGYREIPGRPGVYDEFEPGRN